MKEIRTALAPMRGVTQGIFGRILNGYGKPDLLFTEFFRIHKNYSLEKRTLSMLLEGGEIPVIGQILGEDESSLLDAAKVLLEKGFFGIDLNLGCPAPKVYKKKVGGGLLRDLEKVDRLLGFLREGLRDSFLSIKTRIGFDCGKGFGELLEVVERHDLDLFSLHARTVKALYSGPVESEYFKTAAKALSCPVLANGDIQTAADAVQLIKSTGCQGVMVGRAVIRNPWIFGQIRALLEGRPMFMAKLKDVREYIGKLYEGSLTIPSEDKYHLSYLKKFLNFIGTSVDSGGHFLKKVRRSETTAEMLNICDELLLGENAEREYSLFPYDGLIARPNREF